MTPAGRPELTRKGKLALTSLSGRDLGSEPLRWEGQGVYGRSPNS